ncbi:MAG: elongation factor G [Candidatus Omnitrophica bacterium]|nr:elongation factor G [Candidatus Omnitrophota bacterium]
MAVSTKDIRNVVIISHSGEGKTTLVENLLFKGGAISRKGTVSEGTTVSDYNEDEKERKNSINMSASFYEKDGIKVNILDAPGFLDFMGEVVSGIAAADAVILLVESVGGIKVGTTKFWKLAQEKNLPAIIVVNKMDKENADYDKVLEDIKGKLCNNAVAVGMPVGAGPEFKGIVNLLTKEGIDRLSGDDKAKAASLSAKLIEGVAESNDALLEKFLEAGTLSDDEFSRTFREGVVTGKIVPVLPAAAEKGIGVEMIMQMIKDYFPSPLDVPGSLTSPLHEGEEPQTIACKKELPFAAQVFKTISDPFAGQISIFKVKSGSVIINQTVKNAKNGGAEKLGHLSFMRGKTLLETDSVIAGDIAAVAKLKDSHTNDTLCDEKHPLCFGEISFPQPAVSVSLKPKSRGDEDKISGALQKLTAEDQTFRSVRDPQTNELVVSGMGDLHLKSMINRMRARYHVEVEIGTPKVAYKETITGKGDSQYRHKKQSGGAGQFAEVWLRVEPGARGSGYEFVDEIVGGAINKSLLGSTEKGIAKAVSEGVIAGYPVVDVKVTVYDGKMHPVDSKDIAFQIAGAHAFKQAFEKAHPVLLEPIMHVDLTIPKENTGDITGSLSPRRGRVIGMGSEGDMELVTAEIPLEEMYKYANELKSITGGRATYTMTFSTYEVVPPNIAQHVIAANKKAKEEEHHN